MRGMRTIHGFALLELLVVLAVIAILVSSYVGKGGGAKPEQGTYEMSMSRSHDAACIANRSAARTNLEMFRMNNPSTPITAENLQKAGMNVPTCPDGGAYGFTADGGLVCNKHPDKK